MSALLAEKATKGWIAAHTLVLPLRKALTQVSPPLPSGLGPHLCQCAMKHACHNSMNDRLHPRLASQGASCWTNESKAEILGKRRRKRPSRPATSGCLHSSSSTAMRWPEKAQKHGYEYTWQHERTLFYLFDEPNSLNSRIRRCSSNWYSSVTTGKIKWWSCVWTTRGSKIIAFHRNQTCVNVAAAGLSKPLLLQSDRHVSKQQGLQQHASSCATYTSSSFFGLRKGSFKERCRSWPPTPDHSKMIAEKSCWQRLLRKVADKDCWGRLLRKAAEKSCCERLLRRAVRKAALRKCCSS